MILFDIVTIAVVAWMIFKGISDGLVAQALSLGGVVLGIYLAITYGSEVGEMCHIPASYAAIAGFIIILVLTMIVSLLLSKIISRSLSFIGLGWLNRVLGVIFAVVKGVVILGLFYAAIYSVNARFKIVDPALFGKSVSFNIVRTVAEPLIEYWDASAPAAPATTTNPEI